MLGIKVRADQAKSEGDALLNSVQLMVCMPYSRPRWAAHNLHSLERPNWADSSRDLEARSLEGNSRW